MGISSVEYGEILSANRTQERHLKTLGKNRNKMEEKKKKKDKFVLVNRKE